MQNMLQTPSPPQTPPQSPTPTSCTKCPYCHLSRRHFLELTTAVLFTFAGSITCARWSPPTIFTDILSYVLILASSFLFGALILSYSIHARRNPGVCGAGPDGGPAPTGGVSSPIPTNPKD
jgi:hypothetical protein